MKIFDTQYLIIGAGLAGSALAFLLRRSGSKVILAELLDTKTKDKLCGGVMLDSAIQSFEKIYDVDPQQVLPLHKVKGFRQRFAGKEIFADNVEFLSLPRKSLDNFTLERALEVGAKLFDRVAIKNVDMNNSLAYFLDLRDKTQFAVRFQFIIGADGASSTLRRLLTGKRPIIIPGLQAQVPCVSQELIAAYLPEMFSSQIDCGYCWYIPQGKIALIGCLAVSKTKNLVPICRNNLENFCSELGVEKNISIRGAAIPIDKILLSYNENAFFIGDAAGLNDIGMGSGIHYAFISANLLFEALNGAENIRLTYEKSIFNAVELKTAKQARKSQFISVFTIIKKGSEIQWKN